MMRKLYLNRRQAKMLNEATELHTLAAKMPSHILDDIQFNKTSLSDNDAIANKNVLVKLSLERYRDICADFKDDITSYDIATVHNKLNKLIKLCQAKERPNRTSLSSLCYNAIVEMFDIPENMVDMEFVIVDEISPDESFSINPLTSEDTEYVSVSDMKRDDIGVMKKRCLNAMVMGAAEDIYNAAMKKILSDIFDIDEELPHMYSMIMKINEYLMFAENTTVTEQVHNMGGFEKIVLGNDIKNAKVLASGLIFPILLREAIRGMLELCITNGLPEDEEYANLIMDRADALRYEPWDMRLGPAIWKHFKNNIEKGYDTNVVPNFFEMLSRINAPDFIEIFAEIAAGTKNSKELCCELYGEAQHRKEYNSFEDDLMQKQDNPDIIEDDYFSDEEINEWAVYN